VAEDNLINQKVARLSLQSLGFVKVDVVTNGREALEAMSRHAYEIVFLDLHMPELDGIETARAIRAKYLDPRPWIVALTASAMAGDREKCLEAGMDDYLAKPLQRDALIMVVDRAKEAIEGHRTTPSSPPVQRRRLGDALRAPAPVIDVRALERLRALGLPSGASGADLVTELIDAFLREVPEKLGKISQALDTEDFQKAHRFSHSLVSAAGNLGALGVVRAARELETLLRLKNLADGQKACIVLKQEFDLAATELLRERQKVD